MKSLAVALLTAFSIIPTICSADEKPKEALKINTQTVYQPAEQSTRAGEKVILITFTDGTVKCYGLISDASIEKKGYINNSISCVKQ